MDYRLVINPDNPKTLRELRYVPSNCILGSPPT